MPDNQPDHEEVQKPMVLASVADTITTLRDALLDMAGAFEVSDSALQNAESRESLSLFKWYTGEEFARYMPQARIDTWLSCFDTDLLLRIDVVDEGETIEVGMRSGRAKLSRLYQKIGTTRIDHIDVRAELSKQRLTDHFNREVGATFNALYFFGETFASRLTLSRLQALFESGVLPHDEHAVVGVVFGSGLVWSKYLTVVGLQQFDPDHFRQLPVPTRYQIKWHQTSMLRDANCVWLDALSTIDPHYLQVRSAQPGLEQVAERLLGLSEALSLLQFCVSVVSRSDGTVTAQISRPGGTLLTIEPEAVFVPLTASSSATLGTPAFQLFKWAYRGEDYDKIDLVRDLVDREVRGREGNAVTHLLRYAPELLVAARAGYKALRVRALESYWKARQEAKDKVDAYVATIGTTIDKLRADMLARAIQFFTAIVTFLAIGVFQPQLPAWIKASGLIFSIVYIMLIGVFQCWPAYLDFNHLRTEAEAAVDSYDVLSPNERDTIKVKLPSGWQSDFVKWLAACGVTYLLELVAFVFLLVVLLIRG